MAAILRTYIAHCTLYCTIRVILKNNMIKWQLVISKIIKMSVIIQFIGLD